MSLSGVGYPIFLGLALEYTLTEMKISLPRVSALIFQQFQLSESSKTCPIQGEEHD